MLYYNQYVISPSHEWVIFVHGAGGSSAIWFKQIRAFKPHFNILLLDLRGHGKSKGIVKDFMNKDYTFEAVSRDILEVMDHLQIKSAHFMGVSLGTIIIRNLGELAPDRVDSLIMAGAITRLNIRSRFFVGVGNMFKRVMPYMWLYKLFAWIIMPRKRHAESRNLFVREAKRLYQKEFLKWFKLTAEVNPLLRYFNEKEIKIPILYVMGEEDHMFLGPVRQMASKHKNAILKVIDKCGHVCNVEQPEVFNQLALSFLQEQRKAS
ncbi:alpha/beta fold hydrolase [Penaeicola halotolerans]|uniref:alpha/beta fold hydrolase n=1 Tax=Penaeicola halotolerans TaxID=2793196 RepID=UPI001CF89D0B|nr:alpha/beta hydrolase [Penaeicola halotolerans]